MAGALLAAAAAWGYPVEMLVSSKGLDVEAHHVLLHDATVVRLTNHEPDAVRCDLVFRNGPELPRRRKVTLDPGGERSVRFRPDREVIKLEVDVRCWRAGEDVKEGGGEAGDG